MATKQPTSGRSGLTSGSTHDASARGVASAHSTQSGDATRLAEAQRHADNARAELAKVGELVAVSVTLSKRVDDAGGAVLQLLDSIEIAISVRANNSVRRQDA